MSLSKQVMFSIFTLTIGEVFELAFQKVTRLKAVLTVSRVFTPNYTLRGDHLYLPEHASVKHTMLPPTLIGLCIFSCGVVATIILLAELFSTSVLLIISGLVAGFYFVFMFFKIIIIGLSLKTPFSVASKEELAALDDWRLPVYTVIVPLRDEAEVMGQIVTAMEQIEYPREKLDLIVTVEHFDHDTKDALTRANIPTHWRVLELPDTAPKTKPKALNCAFLEVRGEYLVIYDAEIIPDPDQLKKALCIFAKEPHMAVLQPRLDHYNTDQNLLTRLFTIEFTFHYDMFLPGLARFMFPVPLSGHSTHFRVKALRESGAWDPYNVAEDCEIGMRLFRHGYRSGIFDSLSLEEAASTIPSWIKQRTRWMKGFIQTTIVHLRYPHRTIHEMGGLLNFFVFLLVVPGTVLINLINIFTLLLLTIWIVFQPTFIQTLYPLPVLYLANFTAIVGGFLFIYFTLIALYRRQKFHLVRWWFTQPLYWTLLSYATVRATIQLIRAPHVWEKTEHGTHLVKNTINQHV